MAGFKDRITKIIKTIKSALNLDDEQQNATSSSGVSDSARAKWDELNRQAQIRRMQEEREEERLYRESFDNLETEMDRISLKNRDEDGKPDLELVDATQDMVRSAILNGGQGSIKETTAALDVTLGAIVTAPVTTENSADVVDIELQGIVERAVEGGQLRTGLPQDDVLAYLTESAGSIANSDVTTREAIVIPEDVAMELATSMGFEAGPEEIMEAMQNVDPHEAVIEGFTDRIHAKGNSEIQR